MTATVRGNSPRKRRIGQRNDKRRIAEIAEVLDFKLTDVHAESDLWS